MKNTHYTKHFTNLYSDILLENRILFREAPSAQREQSGENERKSSKEHTHDALSRLQKIAPHPNWKKDLDPSTKKRHSPMKKHLGDHLKDKEERDKEDGRQVESDLRAEGIKGKEIREVKKLYRNYTEMLERLDVELIEASFQKFASLPRPISEKQFSTLMTELDALANEFNGRAGESAEKIALFAHPSFEKLNSHNIYGALLAIRREGRFTRTVFITVSIGSWLGSNEPPSREYMDQ